MNTSRDYDINLFESIRQMFLKLFSAKSDVIYVAILLVCGGFVYLHGLGRPVAIWDETWYMTASQFSVEHNHWLIPHLPYEAFGTGPATVIQPFLLKPPLGIWFQMLSMEFLGTSEIAARLPAVGFTLLTAVLMYYLGRTIYSRRVGFVAGIVFLTTRLIFIGNHGGRTAGLEAPMLFFGTFAIAAAFLGVRRNYPRAVLLPVSGVAIGATILTKGFGAGIFVLIALPLLIGHWRAFLTREGILAAGLAVAVPLAWFGVVGIFYGNVLDDMLYEQVINRVSGSSTTYPATFGFMKHPYFRKAPLKFDPWWYLLLVALVTVPLGIYRRRGRTRLGTETLFLCWWVLSVFGFFIVAGNHFWHVMPIVVPMGLLCGRLIDRGLRPSPESAGLVIGLYLALMNSWLVGRGIRFVTQGAPSPSPPVRFALVVGCVSVLIAVVYREQWLPVIRPQIDFTGWTTIAKQVFILSLIGLVLFQLPLADFGGDSTTDQQQLAEQFRTTTPSDAIIHVYPSTNGPIYTFVFYAQRPLEGATLQQLNTNTSVQYALVEKSAIEKVQRPHERIGAMTAYKKPLVLIEFVDAHSDVDM